MLTNFIQPLGDIKTLYDCKLVKKSALSWASSASSTMEKTFLPTSLRFKEAQFLLNIIRSQTFVRIWHGIQKIGKLNETQYFNGALCSMISTLCTNYILNTFCRLTLGQFCWWQQSDRNDFQAMVWFCARIFHRCGEFWHSM